MRLLLRRFSWLLLFGVALALGCGSRTPEPAPPLKVTSELDQESELIVVEEELPDLAGSSNVPQLVLGPSSVVLGSDEPGVQFLASVESASGSIGGDRTRSVSWNVEPSGVVSVGPDGYARVIGPGVTTVTASSEDGLFASTDVEVKANDHLSWDFAADIAPIFTRFGCNGGGCHGKATGQNGFHLSLFGYDAEGDYLSLTRDSAGRRLSILDPGSSLLLRKATGSTPHGGGLLLSSESEPYQILRAWIAAGAPELQGSPAGKVVAVEVLPREIRLDEPGQQQLRVVARFDDGRERDVTRLSRFEVRDDVTASVDERGLVTLLRRAETDLVVRYRTEVVTTRISARMNPDLEFDFASLPRRNFVDEHLFARLESLNVPPSPPSDDSEFLRRVSLDLTGQQPRPDQIRAFLDDDSPDRRIVVVDQLMNDPLFVDFWHLKIGDLLQISQARFGNGVYRYNDWVKAQLASNVPWDEFVRTLLTALGNPNDLDGGAVNYALEGQDARDQAELTAQRFLGLRFRCAQCHDHPFDRWTQDDYYGLAAFFAKVGRSQPDPEMMSMSSNIVGINPDGFINHLRTGEPAIPRIPGGDVVEIEAEVDPRIVLADWMTSPENPYFARSAANWAWAQFFGKGLADPSDDLSSSNPPVHPELLDALAEDFIAHGYDLRHLIRTVATSEAYGLSSRPVPGNEGETRLFSHQSPRPLTAHQMADALAQATDTELRFDLARGGGGGGRLVASKAVKIDDPAIASVLLDTFGRCPRQAGCSTIATPTLSLRQALLLVGGTAIDDRITQFNGYLSGLLEFEPTAAEIVENLYLRTLCRKPSEEETGHWSALLNEADSVREASEDLFWALLNSREFAFNH